MVITSVVVGVILTPYFVLILFGKFLLKFDRVREYIRPFYEAIHAPYKPNRWYSFSLYQILLLMMYSTAIFAGNTEALLLVLFNIFLYFQTCSMPFRNKALNLLNLSLLLVLNFVMLVSEYINGDSSKYLVLFFTSTLLWFSQQIKWIRLLCCMERFLHFVITENLLFVIVKIILKYESHSLKNYLINLQ